MGTIENRIKESDLSDLSEPEMSALDWEDFNKGIVLFNSGKYWESHEAWEGVWKRHPENSRIFFQGLIQVAAGLHQLQRKIYHGVNKHFRNALWKLQPFTPIFLGVEVESLIDKLKTVLEELNQSGEQNLHKLKSPPQINKLS
jgi:predicted metal-dependent hydrolase